MKLKCFIGLHKWTHKRESVRYVRVNGRDTFGDHFDKIENIRYCLVCSKKQRNTIGTEWVDYGNLTQDELRDKKLNDLGL